MSIKTKRRICGWISSIAFAAMFGFCGGVECGGLPLIRGTILMSACLAISIGAAYKGGFLN